jgi:hypothetical protein
MDERWVSKQDSAEYIANMYVTSDGAWRSCGGVSADFTYPGHGNPVFGLYQFSQHGGGRQWTLVEHEDTTATARPYKYINLSYIDHRSDALVDIETGRMRVEGPWRGSTFLENNNWVYVLNGYDEPIRWNGRQKVAVGFSTVPAAPSVGITPENQLGGQESHPGLGTLEERWRYGWAVSEVNDLGAVSPPSPIAYLSAQNTTSGTASDRRRLSALVQLGEAPANVRGRLLWRTANSVGVSTVGQQGAALYLVRAFRGGGAISYVDGASDESLLTELDRNAVGAFPVGATVAKLFKGTLFVDGGATTPTRLRYSSAQHIEQFPAVNYLDVGDEGSGRVTGMVATKNALVVFKERGIYLVRGNQLAGFRADTLTEDVGHLAGQNALREIPGLGVVFWNEAGPYVLLGALENTGTPTEWRFIGQGLARTWRTRVNTKALPAIRAEVNHADRELWVLVPEGGDDRPTLGLVYHYETGGWSVREGFAAQSITATREHRGAIMLGGTGGGVFRYTKGVAPPSTAEYRSAWLDLGGERTQVRHIKLEGLTLGSDLQFEWRVDRHPVGYQGGPENLKALVDYERTLPEWGTAVLGTDVWYQEYPSGVRYDLYQCNGFTVQWRVRATRLAIAGADIFFVPSATHIKERN